MEQVEAFGGMEDIYGVNGTVFGSKDYKSLLHIESRYGGVLVLVNPNGDEHFIYPSYQSPGPPVGYQLSAGNRTQMVAGLPGVVLVAASVPIGPIAWRRRLPGISTVGMPNRESFSLAIGGYGGRGGLMLTTVGGASTRVLYFSDTHQLYAGTIAQWRAGTGGTALGTALTGPFSTADERTGNRSAMISRVPGVVIVNGLPTHSTALGLAIGGIDSAMVVWLTAAPALAAGDPATWYNAAT